MKNGKDEIFGKKEKILRNFAGLVCFFVLALVVGCCCVLFPGCRTLAVDSTGIGERNKYIIGQLDSTIQSLNRELVESNGALEECVERSRTIEDGAQRLKYLVGRYFEVTKRIQDANNRAISRLEVLEESVRDSGVDTDGAVRGGGVGALPGADAQD